MKNKFIALFGLFTISIFNSNADTKVPKVAWENFADGKEHIVSKYPSKRWEDSLVSGNGATGIMVYGDPKNETIVVNHEKCWLPTSNYSKDVPMMADAVARSRQKAKKGNFGMAGFALMNELSQWHLRNYPSERLTMGWGTVGATGGGYKVHPAFEISLKDDNDNTYTNYFREMVLDDGLVNVQWGNDENNLWQRNAFVSRPDDVIVIRLKAPKGEKINTTIELTNVKLGYKPEYIKSQQAGYKDNTFYYLTDYKCSSGLPTMMGYRAVGKIITNDGKVVSSNENIKILDCSEALLLIKFVYLDDVKTDANATQAMIESLNEVSTDYNKLLQNNGKVMAEMLNRVKIDFGSNKKQTTEDIIKESYTKGLTPVMIELLHNLGRYALISSTGELPPALMGIWGANWSPAWNGHFTYDSNIQLAISAASTGNLPEAIDAYTRLVESKFDDWAVNAKNLYNARGILAGVGSSWFDGTGKTGSSWFTITGLASWVASYYEEYYQCSGDEKFLIEKEIPFFKSIALFFEDYLKPTLGDDGKYLFYPSLSPENMPDKLPNSDLRTYTSPNPTSEIAMCKFVFNTLIKHCTKLGIESENIPLWKDIVSKLPDYIISEDGGLAEWSYPEVEYSYSNKTAAQYFGVYPGDEFNEFKTPKLYQAASKALKYRLDSDLHVSGHGMLHDCFVAASLKDKKSYWGRLDMFADLKFFYTSLLTSHYANLGIYNLDSTLALPAIFVNMLVISTDEDIELLPVLDEKKIPTGSASGILAKGAVKIEELKWDFSKGEIEATLISKSDKTINLNLPRDIKSIDSNSTSITDSDRGSSWKKLTLKANTAVKLKIKIGEF